MGWHMCGHLCTSHKGTSAKEAGGAAAHAERGKVRKYAHLDRGYLFQTLAVETCRWVGPDSLCFLHDLGHR